MRNYAEDATGMRAAGGTAERIRAARRKSDACRCASTLNVRDFIYADNRIYTTARGRKPESAKGMVNLQAKRIV